MKIFIFGIFSILVQFTIPTPIKQAAGKFVDEYGRVRLFHGVNVVYKVPPYIPSQDEFDPLLSLNDLDIEYMKKFGFNLVRLGIMWEAIEKAPGLYDLDLLDQYYHLVNKFGENGIYTIIDAHQDAFSRNVCGEGVPHFYVSELNYDKACEGSLLKKFLHLIGVCKGMKDFGYRTDENNLPLIEDCKKTMFSKYVASSDSTSLFDKLYNNEQGLLDKFISFWVVVSNKFKGNQYVLGYDIWNEPFPGGLYDHPFSSLIPGKPDKEQLLPFYRQIDKKLRELDPDYVLMYEPTPFPDLLPILFWRFTGNFDDVPITEPTHYNKQVYNYHSYCCEASMNMCDTGEPPLEKAKYCRDLHFEKIKSANEYTKKFNISSVITEFGACFNTLSCFNEISSVADAADEYLTSWAYWMYKPFNDFTTSCPDDKEGIFNTDGTAQEYKVKALTRTYVQAFQGQPISMKFDTKSKLFTSEFYLDKSISQPTLIYYNKENYANGLILEINLEGENYIIDDSAENVLKIYFPHDQTYTKTSILTRIKFYPKPTIELSENDILFKNLK